MDPDAPSGKADAGAEFEEADAKGLDLGRFEFGAAEHLLTEEDHEGVGGGGDGEAEGVGEEAVAGEAMGEEAAFHLLDVVFGVPALFVEGEEIPGGSGEGGDEKAEVGAVLGGLEFDAHLAGTLPVLATVTEREVPALGSGGLLASIGEFPERGLHPLPERVGGVPAEEIVDPDGLSS